MNIANQFKTLDCQLADEYDPMKKVVVSSRQEKDDYLLPKICKQIEFYLSDANLLHDNFFKNLLKEHKNWIPFQSLIKCNKIKLLLRNYPKGHQQQLNIIGYALQRSEILEVDEERHCVKRKIAFKDDPKYMDERTIYIENIPKIVDHQLLHKIFTKIDQQILQIKKFDTYAFITFLNKESVNKAIQVYNNLVPNEIIERKIMSKGGLRVVSKTEWLNYKNQCKSIRKKKNNQFIQEEPVLLKLRGIDYEDLHIEEIRIAVSHAVNPKQVKHINIDNQICLVECVNQNSSELLIKQLQRIQNYDDRFHSCQIDDS